MVGKAGSTLAFLKSVVIVEQPAVVTAKKATALDGLAYDVATQKTGAVVKVAVAAGQRVYVLKYEGEGDCLIQHAGKTYYAGCPGSTGDDDFSTGDRKASKLTWWVQVKGDRGPGWLIVDRRLEVIVQRP